MNITAQEIMLIVSTLIITVMIQSGFDFISNKLSKKELNHGFRNW